MKNLLKISFSVSLIGVFLLLFLSNFLEPKLTNIENINYKLSNKKVHIQGTISNIKTYENSSFQIITIKDSTGKIDITTNKILNLTKNQSITVIGTITEYNQTLQIQADKVVSLS